MDRVLVDAPCTGTGTWRRRPDTKWRLTEKNLDERCQQQAEVLEAASHHVRPGGFLAYVTCSLLPQENEDRIAAFCADHPDFAPVDALSLYRARFGAAAPAPVSTDGRTITLTPASTGTDGFYFALLARAG